MTGVKPKTDTAPYREIGGCLNSSVRDQALLLATWLELDPGDPIVPVLVQRVESAAGGGHWYTTQENAMALVALGKYARLAGPPHRVPDPGSAGEDGRAARRRHTGPAARRPGVYQGR